MPVHLHESRQLLTWLRHNPDDVDAITDSRSAWQWFMAAAGGLSSLFIAVYRTWGGGFTGLHADADHNQSHPVYRDVGIAIGVGTVLVQLVGCSNWGRSQSRTLCTKGMMYRVTHCSAPGLCAVCTLRHWLWIYVACEVTIHRGAVWLPGSFMCSMDILNDTNNA